MAMKRGGPYPEAVESVTKGAGNGLDEIRATDSTTGAQKGRKLARFSLLPWDALHVVAEHFGRGAEKYTRYGICSCVWIAVNADSESPMPSSVVDGAMRKTFDSVIPASLSVNAQTVADGPNSTRSGSAQAMRDTVSVGFLTRTILPVKSPHHMDSRSKTISGWLVAPAAFAERLTNLVTATMTTSLDGYVARYAIAAISDSDSSKPAVPNGSTLHVAGCSALKVERSGERNWEGGYPWSWSYDALCRHLGAWWQGEDRDAETGSLHITAVAWHALVLLAYRLRGAGTDDRPGMVNGTYIGEPGSVVEYNPQNGLPSCGDSRRYVSSHAGKV